MKEICTDKRRKLLKSIAGGSSAVIAGASLPDSWSKPMVSAVILPAHAETTSTASAPASEPTTTTTPVATTTPLAVCSLAEGCYTVDGSGTYYIYWPGGTGPYADLPATYNSTCTGMIGSGAWNAMVIARSLEEAEAIWDENLIDYGSAQFAAQQPPGLGAGCYLIYG